MLAFTFPGQGSQRAGAGRPWLDHPSWELVHEVSEAAGRDVASLLLDADADELRATRNAQLATFTLSLLVLDAIERLGIAPSAVAGHSLGEYSALVASGALGFEDGVKLVVERSEAMQAAADDEDGTMVVLVGVSDADAEAACQRAEGGAWVANFNAPGQVVIAGTPEGVATASEIAKAMGARKVLPIPVGGAFHTPLMAPARARLRKALAHATFSDPEVPVTANVDARAHTLASEWPGLLSAQLCGPVRWHQTLLGLASQAQSSQVQGTIVEVGPGGVLTGLAKRTIPEQRLLAVATPDDLDALVDALSGDSPLHTYALAHAGEHLYMSERVVVSPATGIFEPLPCAASVEVGGVLGTVGETDVRTPFAGALMGLLAMRGERVVTGQPVAWLRTGSSGADSPSGGL
ncbi:MAG: ACP S-malonyltransferase [Acidimicrobiales bacterium]